MRIYDEDDESSATPVITTLGDLAYAVSRARTQEQRLSVYMAAAWRGWAHKLPREWNPNGTITKEGEL